MILLLEFFQSQYFHLAKFCWREFSENCPRKRTAFNLRQLLKSPAARDKMCIVRRQHKVLWVKYLCLTSQCKPESLEFALLYDDTHVVSFIPLWFLPSAYSISVLNPQGTLQINTTKVGTLHRAGYNVMFVDRFNPFLWLPSCSYPQFKNDSKHRLCTINLRLKTRNNRNKHIWGQTQSLSILIQQTHLPPLSKVKPRF